MQCPIDRAQGNSLFRPTEDNISTIIMCTAQRVFEMYQSKHIQMIAKLFIPTSFFGEELLKGQLGRRLFQVVLDEAQTVVKDALIQMAEEDEKTIIYFMSYLSYSVALEKPQVKIMLGGSEALNCVHTSV